MIERNKSSIAVLEQKIIGLLNKLKGNHLDLVKFQDQNEALKKRNSELEEQLLSIREENKSLKIANNLLGSNEGKQVTKSKINSLIREVENCIQQVSEMNWLYEWIIKNKAYHSKSRLSIQDTQRPQIQNFYIYSSADNYQSKKEYPLNKKNDSVYTTAAIETGGAIQVGLRLFDRQNLSYSKNGIYSASVRLNGKEKFSYSIDRISFEDSKSINLIIDYKNLKQNRKRIQRFAKNPESKFTFLKESPLDGTLQLTPNKSYQLLVRVSDYKGNATYVEAYLSGIDAPKAISKQTNNVIDPIKDYLFDFDSTSVYFPKKTFFQKADIQVEYTGDTLRVGKDIIPLKNPYEISFTIPKMDSLEREQSFIGKLDRKGKPYFVSSKIEDNKWIAKSKTLGDFIISRDSISPKIVPLNFKNKQWLSNYSFLKFKITDDYSGIKSYRGEINGKWILLEHEPKKNTLIYDFDDLKFDQALHQLNIEAEDFAGNKTNFSTDFYRK